MPVDADEKVADGSAAAPSEPAAATLDHEVTTALARARADLVARRVADAEAGYPRVLTVVPSVALALHELGICRQRQGDSAGAANLIVQAIALSPEIAEFHSN